MMTTKAIVFLLCISLHGSTTEGNSLEITEDELFIHLLFDGIFRLDFSKALVQVLKECLCTSENCAFSIAYLAINTYTVINTTLPGMGVDLSPWPIFACTAPTFAYVQAEELIDCRHIEPNSIDQPKTCYPYTTLRSESTVCPCINIWWIQENPSCPDISEPDAAPCDTSIASTSGYVHDETTSERPETTALLPTTDRHHSLTSDGQTPGTSGEEQGGSKGNNSGLAIAAGVIGAVAATVIVTVIVIYIMRRRKARNTENSNQPSSVPASIDTQPNPNNEATSVTESRYATSPYNDMAAVDNYGYAEYINPGSTYCTIGEDGLTRVDPERNA